MTFIMRKVKDHHEAKLSSCKEKGIEKEKKASFIILRNQFAFTSISQSCKFRSSL